MTIPVPNAPRYQVGQKPPPPDDEEARELARRAAAEASLRLETQRGVRVIRMPRGCLASALLLGALGTCCGGAIAWGLLGGGFDAVRDQMLVKIGQDLRSTSESQGQLETNRGALDQLEELRVQRRVDWLAFSVLSNRWTDAKTDRVITAEELERLMVLVRDIDSRSGSIDPEDYPEGR
ncbi:MAG: hypothetical protein K1X94_13345 [Sandaracinaceae bacterium]|nr:hypothetical protein [Sandaracinaceae bacterium]